MESPRGDVQGRRTRLLWCAAVLITLVATLVPDAASAADGDPDPPPPASDATGETPTDVDEGTGEGAEEDTSADEPPADDNGSTPTDDADAPTEGPTSSGDTDSPDEGETPEGTDTPVAEEPDGTDTDAPNDESSTEVDEPAAATTTQDTLLTSADSTTSTADSTTSTDDASIEPTDTTASTETLAPQFISGEPVYEITGGWVDPPDTVSRGNPVVAEWRININDSGEPPGNDPVDDVTATFGLTNAIIDEIPDMCLVDGVDPPSSLSDDGTALTCNFGTVNLGTAIVLQTPVVPTGNTGEFVSHNGTVEDQTVELDPIEILNPFAMDMYYGQNTNFRNWEPDVNNPQNVTADIQWTLRLGDGSDPGPDSVTYTLTVTTQDGSPIQVGTNPRESSEIGCSPHRFSQTEGHPFSDRPDRPARNAPFADSCTLTQVDGDTFTLTISGIDYSLLTLPEVDSSGNTLPPNWDVVATGSLWFQVNTNDSGSIRLAANSPAYEAPTGQTFQDLAGNNTTTKAYTLPGSWAAHWQRSFTGSGGTPWDDSFRVPAGTLVSSRIGNAGAGSTPGETFGSCLILDSDFVTYEPGSPQLYGWDPAGGTVIIVEASDPLPGYTFQWFVGDTGDPDTFDCGAAGWLNDEPADPTTVQAVRVTWDAARYADPAGDGSALPAERFVLFAHQTINPDVLDGQDVWMWGSALKGDGWLGAGRTCADRTITPTPDARYGCTHGRRDILRVVTALPHVAKEAAEATITPGVPADFTLTYSATGSALLPPTVDGFQIRDVLPPSMMYVEGSATPEPTVTTNADGQQVLVWTIDGVATNVEHELSYQAVTDADTPPGTSLTNTAEARMGPTDTDPTPGEWTDPVEVSVTTTTNGYTTILKTADVDYIPNDDGDGSGTGSWTVTIESVDPLPQAYTDTIDILPYNGDLRGTSFTGTYSVVDVVTPDGGTVYYTTTSPDQLTYDPADPSNGAAPGDPTDNTVGWSTTPVENPTAIRVIGEELAPGASFSFQVVITTDGATPQDVYWNSAQARAEHTELVMRTSAPLVVTDFEVAKTSDPASGSAVSPGDVINYTITASQIGDVPAGAWLTDDLSAVLDDATYNGDVSTDAGTVSIDGDLLRWEAELPVGGTATITYSVTVDDGADLAADGDAVLTNVVTSPGCPTEEACTTTHSAGQYEYSKTSDPESGSEVSTGDIVTYQVRIAATVGRIDDAVVTDDLSAVLDDATWNGDLEVPVGTATLDGTILTWTGDLGVDEVVTLTYSVTVNGDGDGELANVVTSPDTERVACVSAPDGNQGCATEHRVVDPEVLPIQGELPVTGSDSGSMIPPSLLLIGAGAVLMVAARWRRVGLAGVGSPQRPLLGDSRLAGKPGLGRAGAPQFLGRRIRPAGAERQAQRCQAGGVPPPGDVGGRLAHEQLRPQRE